MIYVYVYRNSVSVRGHANYAEHGKDIVCAAVSMLAQNLIKSIEELTDDTVKYEISQGTVDIYFRDLSEKSKTLVDSFFIGISTIAREYPDNVRIV